MSGALPELPERFFVHAHVGGKLLPVGVVERTGRAWPPVQRGLRFRYGKRWLDSVDTDSFEIDPINLPFGSGWIPAPADTEIHGAFRDAGPDGWGQELIRKRWVDRQIGMVEILLSGAGERTGLLGFSTDTSGRSAHDSIDAEPIELEELLRISDAIQENEAAPPEIARLLGHGSSLGGARPKAGFRHKHALWVAKFPHREDDIDVQKAEAACLDMAEAIGIVTPAREVVEVRGAGNAPRTILLVKRFDRIETDNGAVRLAYLSAETVLGRTGGTYNSTLRYGDLMAIATRLGHAAVGAGGAGPEIFRRLLLNVVVHNTDDHLRNHAFIRAGGKWRLSPVFDVVPQAPGNDQMALGLVRTRFPTIAEAIEAARTLALDDEEASASAANALPVLARWREFMAKRGVVDADMRRLAPRFAEIDRWASDHGSARKPKPSSSSSGPSL
ncbi:MAG: HipA domain-containing protein [Alphaproteobacteria bacterium]|nr:HipA domain-containing protein [Alphaproteobacteria bacterium]